MPIELKMPALSPTMEEGTLAKWLVKEGDEVNAGDLLAEIETDKATMEFEAVDEGTISQILVAEGTDNVKVGETIAMIAGEDEDASAASAAAPEAATPPPPPPAEPKAEAAPAKSASLSGDMVKKAPAAPRSGGDRIIASPLARRIAEQSDVDLAHVTGTGPGGRIVKADVVGAQSLDRSAEPVEARGAAVSRPSTGSGLAVQSQPVDPGDIPHEVEKLSNIRKTIARRLTEAKQTIPHIYLTVDIQLDKLLELRKELNASLEEQGVKLSVNDLLIKALAKALIAVPKCNVSFAGDNMIKYSRADISVAVSTERGLITPIIESADTKAVGAISTEMKALAEKARDGKLQPHEYQGGTASLSNMGMFGIKQFDAVINPPQAMIMAISAGEQRPYVVDGALSVATVMSATGSFDHRAIDGADGAELMKVFKALVENPLGMLA